MAPVVLVLLLVLKGFLFEQLLLAFRLRARTALLGSLSLASYSEFGLIVAAIAAKSGWLSSDWLAIVAITVGVSLVIAALAQCALSQPLRAVQRSSATPGARGSPSGRARDRSRGRQRDDHRDGASRYRRLRYADDGQGPQARRYRCGPGCRRTARGEGRNVVQGSATDADFWHRLHLDDGHIKLVLLAMPKVSENVFAAEHLIKEGFAGTIGAVAKFPDDEAVLRAAGVSQVFNLYAEAGAGFAQHVCAGRGRETEDRLSRTPGAAAGVDDAR
jgi:glutathione-regulated potassium-efflux system ancillary protein KefC